MIDRKDSSGRCALVEHRNVDKRNISPDLSGTNFLCPEGANQTRRRIYESFCYKPESARDTKRVAHAAQRRVGSLTSP